MYVSVSVCTNVVCAGVRVFCECFHATVRVSQCLYVIFRLCVCVCRLERDCVCVIECVCTRRRDDSVVRT